MKCLHKNSIRNAVITRVKIGIEDHGFLTMSIHLDFGGALGQMFGGRALWAEGWENKPVTNYAGRYIYNILDVVGVKSVTELVGKAIRVDGSCSGIDGIGHIIEDNFFYPNEKEEKQWKKYLLRKSVGKSVRA